MPAHVRRGRLTIFAIDVTATWQRAATAHFIPATIVHVISYTSTRLPQVYAFLRHCLPQHHHRLGQAVHLLNEFATICVDAGVVVRSATPTHVPLEGHRLSVNLLTLKSMAIEKLLEYL